MKTDAGASTCLYFGPDGKRCERAAAEGGFCEKHDPERTSRPLVTLLRIAAAVMLLVALIWPLLADFLRELRGELR
jgi:hypothetical protein